MNTPDLTLPVQLSLMDELRLSCRKLFLRRHEVFMRLRLFPPQARASSPSRVRLKST